MRRPWVLRLTFLLIGLAAAPAHSSFTGFERRGFPREYPNGRGAPVPSIQATRINGHSVDVDGRLDDPVWENGSSGSGFLQWDPDRGRTPSEETVFKVAYDDEAIYFAVACHEDDHQNINSSLSRRDNIRDSDMVSIYIDPYHDRNTGYNFRVNPAGVQEDYYLYNDGDRDRDWNAVWEAETSRDENGWYAEVRIPFSSIRYRAAPSMTWGLQVYRYMHRRGEDTAWAIWDEQANGFVSRFGELTDIQDVRSPRQLEVLPYFLQKSTDPATAAVNDQMESFQNVGGDLKYGVTPDLTLNATVNPDFGQVEADPALLNLSPFETFFEEKRPFFVEGNRFFQQPDFNLFYSRRIGTGDPNSRILAAGKLTGKAAGNVSVAGLYAATDIANPGQSHNLFKPGEFPEQFFVGRLGKDFAGGNRRLHVMGTATVRNTERLEEDDEGRYYRDGYSAGSDFEAYFKDRNYRIGASVVASRVDPKPVATDSSVAHESYSGTGGEVSLSKYGGQFRGSLGGRWESDQLDLNDVGFLAAPNEMSSWIWLGWRYRPGDEPKLNQANLNFNYWGGWIYAGQTVTQEDTGDVLWSYEPRLPSERGGNVNGYLQFRNYWGLWYGVRHSEWRRDAFITRGGPLMRRPPEYGGWLGFQTDWRAPLSWELEFGWVEDGAGGYFREVELDNTWNASSSFQQSISIGYWQRKEFADYLDTIDRDDPSQGIGGTSYVFGDLSQQTVDVTFRSSLLFSRSQSLEMYVQPFMTVGDYDRARELVEPDSYDLADYSVDGFQAQDYDFQFTAANLNMVYRWEYRPGSTLFLVWTHSRSGFDERSDGGNRFDNSLRPDEIFRNEAENILMLKLTYWLSI